LYLSIGIGTQLPKVSYIKAIDVWMSFCLIFVFFAFLEYCIVNAVARRQQLKIFLDLKLKVYSLGAYIEKNR